MFLETLCFPWELIKVCSFRNMGRNAERKEREKSCSKHTTEADSGYSFPDNDNVNLVSKTDGKPHKIEEQLRELNGKADCCSLLISRNHHLFTLICSSWIYVEILPQPSLFFGRSAVEPRH